MVDLPCKAHKYNLLPEGLNELMTDISREVLRAQPDDINEFIARYLGALLEARKALTLAGDVCENLRTSCCETNEEHKANVKEDSFVDENNISIKEQHEENAKDSSVDENADKHETNGSQNAINVGEPTQNESLHDRPGSSCVEAEEYYRYRQHRDFWSHSVFSLPGSYMNLPTCQPYSVYDSITTASKPSSKRDHSGNSDYIVDQMCDDDSLT